MSRLRPAIVVVILMAALFVGGGVASAGVDWCDSGSPPPMDVGIASNPQHNPNGMPTPDFKNANGKFTANPMAGKNGVPADALVPPGMTQAVR